jgi:hypothetical protein
MGLVARETDEFEIAFGLRRWFAAEFLRSRSKALAFPVLVVRSLYVVHFKCALIFWRSTGVSGLSGDAAIPKESAKSPPLRENYLHYSFLI